MNKQTSNHAKALAKLGASKGGKARASVLTPEQRSEVARAAVRARWARVKGIPLEGGQVSESLEQEINPSYKPPTPAGLPLSLFQGILTLGDISFPCHVLDTGDRVIAQREVVRALTGLQAGNLSRYLSSARLSNYIDLEHILNRTIQFAIPATQYEAIGYEATLLVDICDAYLKAREDGVLTRQYNNIARRAEAVVRACAKVGIVALIDEVTGYQDVRAKNALQLKLQAFIAEEMQEWALMFPEEFWVQLARLENVHYSPRSRPLRWGRYVMAFVYDAVDKDVGEELRKKNPNPHFGQNHHQWLREFGRTKVRDHLNQVLGVMKTCLDMKEFNNKFGYVFKKSPLQLSFFDLVENAHRS